MSMEDLAHIWDMALKVFKQSGRSGLRAMGMEFDKSTLARYAWLLLKAVHGTPGAGLCWQKKLEKDMESGASLEQSVVAPALWYRIEIWTEAQCRKEGGSGE